MFLGSLTMFLRYFILTPRLFDIIYRYTYMFAEMHLNVAQPLA